MEQAQSFRILTFSDQHEQTRRQEFLELLRACPIPDDEFLLNLGLFLTPQTLSRVLFFDFLYRQIIDVQGIIIEFGCRWGQSVSLFSALRGIYEPFNRLRKIVAFDTFAGFPTVSVQDGPALTPGKYAVTPEYAAYLDQILKFQEQESPLAHVKKYEIWQGDASVTIQEYLTENPETIVALAYFDLDLYESTRACLLSIKDRLTRGSVIGFDELNDHACPGETLACKEVFGLDRYPIRRFPYNSRTSYLVVD
jgi:hypothetical protein